MSIYLPGYPLPEENPPLMRMEEDPRKTRMMVPKILPVGTHLSYEQTCEAQETLYDRYKRVPGSLYWWVKY